MMKAINIFKPGIKLGDIGHEIQSYVDQQIDMFAQQIGSMDKLIEYYNKSSEQELRTEMFELNKNSELAKKMQESIIQDIEVTPEEVRQFFKLIPKAERPIFGTELRVSQIVIIPKTTEEEKEKVVDRLRQFKADVVENGASFVTKAVLYSDDSFLQILLEENELPLYMP